MFRIAVFLICLHSVAFLLTACHKITRIYQCIHTTPPPHPTLPFPLIFLTVTSMFKHCFGELLNQILPKWTILLMQTKFFILRIYTSERFCSPIIRFNPAGHNNYITDVKLTSVKRCHYYTEYKRIRCIIYNHFYSLILHKIDIKIINFSPPIYSLIFHNTKLMNKSGKKSCSKRSIKRKLKVDDVKKRKKLFR